MAGTDQIDWYLLYDITIKWDLALGGNPVEWCHTVNLGLFPIYFCSILACLGEVSLPKEVHWTWLFAVIKSCDLNLLTVFLCGTCS